MGISSINGLFSMAMLNNQRVCHSTSSHFMMPLAAPLSVTPLSHLGSWHFCKQELQCLRPTPGFPKRDGRLDAASLTAWNHVQQMMLSLK